MDKFKIVIGFSVLLAGVSIFYYLVVIQTEQLRLWDKVLQNGYIDVRTFNR